MNFYLKRKLINYEKVPDCVFDNVTVECLYNNST